MTIDLQAIEAREDRCLGCLIHLEGLPEVVQHAYAAFGDRTALLAEVTRLRKALERVRDEQCGACGAKDDFGLKAVLGDLS